MAQNGSAGGKKSPSNTLPELEYRGEGRGKNESKKQHNHNQNHHSSTSSSILPSVDSKAQEMEYMENHINSKRLSTSDLLGSTENLLKEEHSSSSSSSSSSNSNKNYKNASGGSSSPRGHGTANGSVPSSSGPSSSSSKGDKKQKCGGGKNSASHRDPVENCIPNNQLSKPEALIRLVSHITPLSQNLAAVMCKNNKLAIYEVCLYIRTSFTQTSFI